jgi:hypothetical protein
MSSKKLTALIAQIPDDFVPLFGLTVCFGIWLVLNLPAKTRVLERFSLYVQRFGAPALHARGLRIRSCYE